MDDLVSRLKRASAGFQAKLEQVMIDKAGDAIDVMIEEVPVDTGNLMRSTDIDHVDAHEASISSTAPYAGYVEFGHRTRGGGGMGWVPAQPFFRPGLDKGYGNIMEDMMQAFYELIEG